jgi:hypothetical protein
MQNCQDLPWSEVACSNARLKDSKSASGGVLLGDLPPEKWTPGYAYFASAGCGVM